MSVVVSYFGKIHSCDKEFSFPKLHFDLPDVGEVVPNKGESIPYMGLARKISDRSSEILDTQPFKLFERIQIFGN